MPTSVYMPDVQVEIAFNAGWATDPALRTWTDVSAYVELEQRIKIEYGRGDEFAETQANELTLTLDNTDGRFTAGRAASPYYPNVRLGRVIRVTATPVGGTASIRFLGYIDQWPTEWDGTDTYARAVVTAKSNISWLAGGEELGSFIDLTLENYDSGTGTPPAKIFLPFDDRVGAQPVGTFTRDQIGGNTAVVAIKGGGTTFAPVFETQWDEVPTVYFEDGYGICITIPPGLYLTPAGGGITAECIFNIGLDTYGFKEMFHLRSARLNRGYGPMQVTFDGTGSPPPVDRLQVRGEVLSSGGLPSSPTGLSSFTPPNGAGSIEVISGEGPHHVAISLSIDAAGILTNKLYVNGVLEGTGTNNVVNADGEPSYLSNPAYYGQLSEIWLGCIPYTGGSPTNWTGHIGRFAVHNPALSDPAVATHADLLRYGSSSERTTSRFTRMADVYAGLTDAQVQDSVMPAQGITLTAGLQQEGRTLLDVFRELATAESGVLYDRRSGPLVFQTRDFRYYMTPSLALSVTAGDVGTGITPTLDFTGTVNDVTVTPANGDPAQRVFDAVSRADYGIKSDTPTLSVNAAEALRRASWEVFTRAEPRTRVPALPVDLLALGLSQQNALFGLEVGYGVSVTGLPSQSASSSMTLILEGMSEEIGPETYEVKLNVSSADVYGNVLTLDSATYGKYDTTPIAF